MKQAQQQLSQSMASVSAAVVVWTPRTDRAGQSESGMKNGSAITTQKTELESLYRSDRIERGEFLSPRIVVARPFVRFDIIPEYYCYLRFYLSGGKSLAETQKKIN